MAINSTTITVPGRPAFTVPGALTVREVQQAFGAELGISNMDGSSTDNEAQGIRYVEFKHKSGNKGA